MKAKLPMTGTAELLALVDSKAQGTSWDWPKISASLPLPVPKENWFHELTAKQTASVWPPEQAQAAKDLVERGKLQDQQAFQTALNSYNEKNAEWEKLKPLARRILSGEHRAFIEALVELSPLGELSDLGSEIHFTVESSELLSCEVKVSGTQAIPSEIKSLTASEKLSIKPMPKVHFHEIYQDYIAGCVIRVARQTFAVLPIKTILVTAFADITTDVRNPRGLPVLSAAIFRKDFANVDFESGTATDLLPALFHRSNFKATRKSGAFQAITPLTPAEVELFSDEQNRLPQLLAKIGTLRDELKSRNEALSSTDGGNEFL